MSEIENCCGTTCDKARLASEMSELKAKIAEQAAQIERIKTEINAIINDSQGVAGYHLNGNVALWDEFDLLDILQETPAQCLTEHDAVVGRKAFIAGVNVTGQGYNGEHGISADEIIELADLYVKRKIRQQATKCDT